MSLFGTAWQAMSGQCGWAYQAGRSSDGLAFGRQLKHSPVACAEICAASSSSAMIRGHRWTVGDSFPAPFRSRLRGLGRSMRAERRAPSNGGARVVSSPGPAQAMHAEKQNAQSALQRAMSLAATCVTQIDHGMAVQTVSRARNRRPSIVDLPKQNSASHREA